MLAMPKRPEEFAALLEEEKKARLAAEAAVHAKDELLGAVTHELRTPLTSILLWAKILQSSEVTEKERREAIDAIERSATAQSEMIDDLLDLSRMMSGRMKLNMREMELMPSVRAAVESARPRAVAQGIMLETVFEARVGRARVDPPRVQQMVWNLLANAIRFTPKDGQIKVTLRHEGANIELKVADTGKGIAPELLPSAFEMFRPAGSKGGGQLSVSLALVQQLVGLHGGTVSAESPGEGQGTTITVRLPRIGDGAPIGRRMPQAQSKGQRLPQPKLLQAMRTLVVEDEADTRNVIRWLLERSGADVTAVGSAAEAMGIIAKAGADRPEMLLSDIGMPGEDGYELMRKIRALEADGSIRPMPAVAITAYVRDEDRRRAYRAGYQAFVPKPIDPDELVMIVASLAGRTGSK
jgi:CheY-like chemotaxis protein